VNPDTWQKVREVFEAAIELEPARRPAYLEEACAGSPALRAEVESLLASHESTCDFIDRPVYEIAPDLLQDSSAEALIGRHLGPYRVVELLGHGGMGIVYLAEDTRLARKVAMKALAPQFTTGEAHRERLRREARAAAALSHPGVATVYSLEEFDGVLYIISEYVRGETLRSELVRGPLATKLLLDTAIDLSSALAAAHEQGVIHRDIKPENVIRTPDGRIKVLDFGLARIGGGNPAEQLPGKRLTRAGTFLGTPAYASPEQLRGLEIDSRTDIFSLGVLLYELASGIHPFGGKDSISTVARVMEKDPVDLTQLSPPSPARLDQIIRRCLSKNPGGRYATAHDLATDLERLKQEIERAQAQPPQPQPAPSASGSSPLWWWQFHQVAAALAYYFLLYPLWRVREWIGGISGSAIFFGALISVGIAANLRLHLWFTSRFYLSELADQRRKVLRWLRSCEVLFIMILVAAAGTIERIHAFWAALILGSAIACLVSFLAIEPATTRAALGSNWDSDGSRR
jgi:serine/threonine protein kinase